MALRCPPDRQDATPVLSLSPQGGHTDELDVGTNVKRLAPQNPSRRVLTIYADPANTAIVRVLLNRDGESSKGWPLAAGAAVEVLNPQEVRGYSESGTQTLHLMHEVD